MTDYDIHRPTFSGTTKNDWEFPTKQDFDTDDLPHLADRFLVSASGFDDPESYDDLQLPVVNSRGYLSLNGLWAAREGPYSVERVPEIDPETETEVKALIEDLGSENFPEFEEVTVSDSAWAAATGTTPANPLGGVVEGVVESSEASYSPGGAVVGLAFLAVATGSLGWVRRRP